MKETNFIKEIEVKAREQRKLVETEVMPGWAKGLGNWLAVQPWRVLIPISGMAYMVSRIVYGSQFREFILGLFGGFVR